MHYRKILKIHYCLYFVLIYSSLEIIIILVRKHLCENLFLNINIYFYLFFIYAFYKFNITLFGIHTLLNVLASLLYLSLNHKTRTSLAYWDNYSYAFPNGLIQTFMNNIHIQSNSYI